jgi:hypothetical protein
VGGGVNAIEIARALGIADCGDDCTCHGAGDRVGLMAAREPDPVTERPTSICRHGPDEPCPDPLWHRYQDGDR